ncbi:MAG: DUF4249 family protein [bacterium]
MKKLSFFIESILASLSLVLLFTSCGESVVEIGQNTYSPKIVVEGYLFPERKVENIKVTRNFALNTQPNPYSLILYSADVRITDLESGVEYKLSYNPITFLFDNIEGNLSIGYDKSYKLSVTALVDGKHLQTSSVTRTPKKGFRILKEESILDSLHYIEKDSSGVEKQFKIIFKPSEGSTFYGISRVALDGSKQTYIEDNPYVEIDDEELDKRLTSMKYQFRWMQNVNDYAERLEHEVLWLGTWFYGSYRTIMYAGDENFRLFALTNKSVQEFDGNFHEPRINMTGDGIGVFGSCIADTVYYTVLK